ncbi:23S rRNA (guanosine(2251)-2'-O)-methyltransferase RlmB [bacterium]|nr:23S rRNA (guanosine(2251)-2'-O)-methyltransferase RlmB [bacterium]|tara:strand:- start:5681 stop:6388 length:708 start_codon:yes stop_codon:yes gene_type:complete
MITIKGKHSVLEALLSGVSISDITVFDQNPTGDLKKIIHLATQKGILVRKQQQKKFHNRQGLAHQNVMATISHLNMQPLSILNPTDHPLVVALDHLEDPFNVGAIMRTCHCLGVNAIIMPKDRQAPINDALIKASSGAAYYMSLIHVSNIANTLINCQKDGYWLYSGDSEQGTNLYDISVAFPTILVVGNEHSGISKRVSKIVDNHIKIEMRGHIDSLNVSVATGIILYELSKQL